MWGRQTTERTNELWSGVVCVWRDFYESLNPNPSKRSNFSQNNASALNPVVTSITGPRLFLTSRGAHRSQPTEFLIEVATAGTELRGGARSVRSFETHIHTSIERA